MISNEFMRKIRDELNIYVKDNLNMIVIPIFPISTDFNGFFLLRFAVSNIETYIDRRFENY